LLPDKKEAGGIQKHKYILKDKKGGRSPPSKKVKEQKLTTNNYNLTTKRLKKCKKIKYYLLPLLILKKVWNIILLALKICEC